jgi:2-polyprenyl-6-methoxyphenol hydroxylase-like FAD-dependent oxidoreductase
VTGVHTDHGKFAADLVIDATGRRSPIDRWLGQLGAAPTATWQAECGVAYFTRHYRPRPGMRTPDDAMLRTIAGLDEFTAGRWPADNGSVMLAVAPLAADRRFRTLGRPEVFTEVLRAVPGYSDWLDVLEPVSGVYPMAGLRNTLRRLVRDEAPVVTGLHAIGDTVCTTNPTLGRGLSLAITGAADLIDTLERHEADPVAQAISLDALVADHIAPFYEDQAAIDAERLAGLRHAIFGYPAPAPAPSPAVSGRVSNAQLRAAAPFDPVLFRAYWKLLGMLCHPAEIYHDPEVVARTDEILRRDGTRPQSAQFQLTR